MKLTFSSATFPAMDFATLAAVANRCGFDGVELRSENASSASASNAMLTSPSKIRQIFSDSQVQISSIHMGLDFDLLAERSALAIELNCSTVILQSDPLFTRSGSVSPKTTIKLLAAADSAAQAGISILLENGPVQGSAIQLWHVLDQLDHPSIACCWNTLTAARAGDAAAVAIPTLNSKIRFVNLQDARRNENTFTACDLGDGELPLRNTANRLRGIGFDGWLLAGLTSGSGFDQLEKSMQAARAKLQQWHVLPALVSG
jgi:sugar phosphate isomerase/epimerase